MEISLINHFNPLINPVPIRSGGKCDFARYFSHRIGSTDDEINIELITGISGDSDYRDIDTCGGI